MQISFLIRSLGFAFNDLQSGSDATKSASEGDPNRARVINPSYGMVEANDKIGGGENSNGSAFYFIPLVIITKNNKNHGKSVDLKLFN